MKYVLNVVHVLISVPTGYMRRMEIDLLLFSQITVFMVVEDVKNYVQLLQLSMLEIQGKQAHVVAIVIAN
jgi:hypothetical protein